MVDWGLRQCDLRGRGPYHIPFGRERNALGFGGFYPDHTDYSSHRWGHHLGERAPDAPESKTSSTRRTAYFRTAQKQPGTTDYARFGKKPTYRLRCNNPMPIHESHGEED